jgi:hypothetical protein
VTIAGYGTVFLPYADIYKRKHTVLHTYWLSVTQPLTKTCLFLSLRLNILLFDDAFSTANVSASLRLEDDAKDLEAVTVT